jgi:hypothetical protein
MIAVVFAIIKHNWLPSIHLTRKLMFTTLTLPSPVKSWIWDDLLRMVTIEFMALNSTSQLWYK